MGYMFGVVARWKPFSEGSFDFGLLPSCAWRVVPDEGFVRYRGEQTKHLLSQLLVRSSAETCCAWDRPRDQANRGINNVELDTQKPCDRDISLCPSILENKMR
jgi:hypothetical protein